MLEGIVVGAGHAGVEAALAMARQGKKTALRSENMAFRHETCSLELNER